MKDAHTRRRTELFEHFGVEYDKGLNNEQVKASLETFGKNGNCKHPGQINPA